MNVRRSWLKVAVVVCSLALFFGAAGAAEFYQYPDDKRFWWYIDTDPAFELIVPSNTGGSYPLYVQTNMYGEDVLEIVMGEDGPVMLVGILKGGSSKISSIWDSIVGSRSHLFTNARLVDNREITTSTGERPHFYSQVARAADGKSAMVRAVIFNKGNDIVYLAYFLYESEFTGFTRDVWINAVNTFRWR